MTEVVTIFLHFFLFPYLLMSFMIFRGHSRDFLEFSSVSKGAEAVVENSSSHLGLASAK